MTPKEKADELVGKFTKLHNYTSTASQICESTAKQCALICVDEILLNFGNTVDGKPFYSSYNAIKFYQQVKQEIQNL